MTQDLHARAVMDERRRPSVVVDDFVPSFDDELFDLNLLDDDHELFEESVVVDLLEEDDEPFPGHIDLLLEEAIPNEFVSTFASNLANSTSQETNIHSVLRLVAGVFIVGDRIFSTLNKGIVIAPPDTEQLFSILHAALEVYRSVDDEAVGRTIIEEFPSSFPTNDEERRAIGTRLLKVVQEHCHGNGLQDSDSDY